MPPIAGGESGLAQQGGGGPAQMPSRYQNPGYLTSQAAVEEDLGAGSMGLGQIRVGATIKSTSGPQPLVDILKPLANLKGMTVSWASDVDQNKLVDVDIDSQDLFQDAVSNVLRQADYFFEMEGKTIVVKNKTTKIFRLGIPYVSTVYNSGVGGNFLPKTVGDASIDTSVEGTAKLTSANNVVDIWANIQTNLQTILDTAAKESAQMAARQAAAQAEASTVELASGAIKDKGQQEAAKKAAEAALARAQKAQQAAESGQRSADGGFYIIDRATGTVTVTAKPSVMKTVENYFSNLKKELFRQVAIEAKIIQVYLDDHSKVGLDWGELLGGLSFQTGATLGRNGAIYSRSGGVGSFVNTILMAPDTFNVFLNALKQQGETHVLANPKLTVMNGQAAVLSVGKTTRFISDIERDEATDDSRVIGYDITTSAVTEGISMGVIATIVDDQKVMLQLTPITSELEGNEVTYRTFSDGSEIGLPVLNMRQMSTTVQVNDGEMLVIGGLIDSVEERSDKGVPILGKIPVIKYLFGVEEKRVRKRELVVLLAPKIL